MKTFYLVCAIAGAIIPFSQFVPWHGPDVQAFLLELFSTRIGAFFGLDVLVSAVALLGFVVWDGRRRQMKTLWLPIAATCLIGVSCGLPLFLFMRERTATRGA